MIEVKFQNFNKQNYFFNLGENFLNATKQLSTALQSLFLQIQIKDQNNQDYSILCEEVQNLSTKYRGIMKNMGENAQVQIEPEVLTFLLDYIRANLNDVIYTVCPGAGGYDSACLISLDTLTSQKLQETLESIHTKSAKEITEVLKRYTISEKVIKELKDMNIRILDVSCSNMDMIKIE